MNTKYRVWWIPQIPGRPFYFPVADRETGLQITYAFAQYDLFQYENHIKPDYANAGGVQVWDDEENDWIDDSFIDDDE